MNSEIAEIVESARIAKIAEIAKIPKNSRTARIANIAKSVMIPEIAGKAIIDCQDGQKCLMGYYSQKVYNGQNWHNWHYC